MMSGLALLEPAALDALADPGSFVIASLERAKSWLAKAVEHGDIEGIKEWKSQAEAIRVYTAQKDLGHDAEVAAGEIVLRATRSLGLVVREGQDNGTVATASPGRPREINARSTDLISPIEVFGHERTRSAAYVMAEADDATFDEVVEEAKAEGNLSRANVVRKVRARQPVALPTTSATQPVVGRDQSRHAVHARVALAKEMAAKGHTSRQIAKAIGIGFDGMHSFRTRHGVEVPADKVVGKARRLDPNRIVRELSYSLEAACVGLDLVEPSELDQIELSVWVASMQESIKTLNRFIKEITST